MRNFRFNKCKYVILRGKNQGFYGYVKISIYTDKRMMDFFLLSHMREVDVSNIKIVLHNPASICAWCEVLGCSEKELLGAIAVIGNSAKEVDEYLIKKRRELKST